MADYETISVGADAFAEARAFDQGPTTNPSFLLGDVVWVKSSTYPWWPALIMNGQYLPADVYDSLKNKLETQTPFMYYCPKGAKPNYGAVPKFPKKPQIEPFGEGKNPNHEKYATFKVKAAKMQMDLLGGITSATEDLLLTNQERLRKLGLSMPNKRRPAVEESGAKSPPGKKKGRPKSASRKEEEEEKEEVDESLTKILESVEDLDVEAEEDGSDKGREEDAEEEIEEESDDDFKTYTAKKKNRKSRKERAREEDREIAAMNSGDESDGATAAAAKGKKRGRKKKRDTDGDDDDTDGDKSLKKKIKGSSVKPGRSTHGDGGSKAKLEREKQLERDRLEKMKMNTDMPVWKQYLGNHTPSAATSVISTGAVTIGAKENVGTVTRESRIRSLVELLTSTLTLANVTSDSDKVLRILKKFEDMNLTYNELKNFKVAEVVGNLRKHSIAAIADAAKRLRQVWIESIKGKSAPFSSSAISAASSTVRVNTIENLINRVAPPPAQAAPQPNIAESSTTVGGALAKDHHTNEQWDMSLVPEDVSSNVVRRRSVRLLHTTIGLLQQSLLVEAVALELANGNIASGEGYSDKYLSIINRLTFALKKSNNKHVLSTLRNTEISREYVIRVVTSEEFLYE